MAALGIAGPKRRFKHERLPGLAKIVVGSAGDLSRRLGFVHRHHVSSIV
jgi:hypothetical protein